MTSDDSIVTDPQSASERVSAVAPGQVLGERYRVEEQLGSGGMGIVCRGTHIGLGTPVAIKLIRPDLIEDQEFVRRFLNEGRRAALLRSERIARVHDVGQLDTGEPYLVMEMLEGLDLGEYLERHGVLPTTDAVNIALQLSEGLDEAHRSGIVHRDIKPANTFLVRRPDGRFAVKILDFGISKQLADGVTTLTDARQSLGSPWYMSPEQMLDAAHVDARSDLWSLGVVLFEMLTGHRPFDGENVPEVCAKVLTTPVPRLSELRPDLDPELEAIVARCLEKEPNDRFPDASSLGIALGAYLTERAEPAEANIVPTVHFDSGEGSIAPVATLGRTRRRRRYLAHAVGILGIAATFAVAALAFGKRAALSARHGAVRLRDELAGAAVAPTPPPPLPAPAPPPPPVAPTAVPAAEIGPPASDPTPQTPVSAASGADFTPAAPPASDAVPSPDLAPAPISAPDSALTAPAPSAPPSTLPAASAPASPSPPAAPAPVRARARSFEPPLTPAEIQARKERYARWLKSEGLAPIE